MAPESGTMYSATYSNVPVIELSIEGNQVMRRKSDDYINATHILKVADYDKPARTRILEREVQKGVHEKIQGGYGKYQGTWIPLHEGRILAERNNVFEKLRKIFEYVSTDAPLPPAPKHTTNPSRPKVPKVPGVKKAPKSKINDMMSGDFEAVSSQPRDDDSQDTETIETASFMDGDDGYGSQFMTGSRKRKRGQDLADQQHTVFADALLDYFILSSGDNDLSRPLQAPQIPATFEINRPIDDHGHTALHWAVAMGDVQIVDTLINRGADVKARNRRGETPLVRAVIFTNNFEKDTMPHLIRSLETSVLDADYHNANVLHHTAMTTTSRLRRKCALYYLKLLLDSLSHLLSTSDFHDFLSHCDKNGDTALHIAARNDSKRCVKVLQQYGARADLMNRNGETVEQMYSHTRLGHQDLISSSPPPMDMDHVDGVDGLRASQAATVPHYHAESARSFSQSFDSMAQEKGLQITLAIEKEYRDKNAALEEAQLAIDKAEQDRQQVQQATLQYLNQDTANDADDDELARMQHEFEILVGEGQAFSEQLQHRELHGSLRDAESRLPKQAHQKAPHVTEEELEERVHVGLELAHEQHKRRKLTAEVVKARAMAGMSATGEAMKRLVAETIEVPFDEVPNIAADLLEELQAAKMDLGGEISVGA